MLLIICFTNLGTTPVWGSNGIFMNASTAKNVAVELKYCRANIPILKEDVDLCNTQIEVKKEQISVLTKEKLGLLEDKKLLIETKDSYQKELINKNKELQTCKDNTPSRFTWFASGVISTLVVGIVGLFLIK